MNEELDLFCRALVGFVFLLAGGAKVFRPISELKRSIAAYQLVPQVVVRVLAGTLPWVELLIATALVAGKHTTRPMATSAQ